MLRKDETEAGTLMFENELRHLLSDIKKDSERGYFTW